MAESMWEFDAKKFVNFGENEHEQSDVEDGYFERNHEDDSNSFVIGNISDEFHHQNFDASPADSSSEKRLTWTDKEKKMSVANIAKPQIESFDNTTSSVLHQQTSIDNTTIAQETINESGIYSINQVTDDGGEHESSNIQQTEDKDASIAKSNKTPAEVPKPMTKSLSNIMTPSRIASWNSGKPVFAGRQGKENQPKSAPAKKAVKKPIRKSLRNVKKELPDGPPVKKAKSNTTKPIPKHTRGQSADVPRLLQLNGSKQMHKRGLTSEEMELAKIEQMRKESQKMRKDNQLQLQKLKNHPSSAKKEHHVTVTEEFHFKTDERVGKGHAMTTRSTKALSGNFESDLRSYQPSPVKLKKTVPQPFNFSKKRKIEACNPQPAPFVPMAKAILAFHEATPRRFKNAKRVSPKKAGPMKAVQITEPKTPNFSLRPRSRPISTMSAKEKEEQEIEEMKKYNFKANPVNKSVLGGKQKLKSVEKKPATVAVGFHLSESHKDDKTKEEPSVRPVPFKAQPVPTKILEKVTGLKKRQVADCTIAQSPAFALKGRTKSRMEKSLHEQEVTKKEQAPTLFKPIKINPGVPFYPHKKQTHKTKPMPFSFDEVDQRRFKKKEEKINEIKEDQQNKFRFKANPMPVPATPSLPPKQVKEATKAKPFHLEADERAATKVQQWNKQIEDETKQLREQTLFKANKDVKVLKSKPFEPKKPHRVVEPLDITMASEKRAAEREKYEMRVRQQKDEREAFYEVEQRRVAEEEEKRIAALRKETVHKANKPRHYKTLEIKASDLALTTPHSPDFSTRFKK